MPSSKTKIPGSHKLWGMTDMHTRGARCVMGKGTNPIQSSESGTTAKREKEPRDQGTNHFFHHRSYEFRKIKGRSEKNT